MIKTLLSTTAVALFIVGSAHAQIGSGAYNQGKPTHVTKGKSSGGSPAPQNDATNTGNGIQQGLNDGHLKGIPGKLGKVKMNEEAIGGGAYGRNPVGDPTGGLGDGSQGAGSGRPSVGQGMNIGQSRGQGPGGHGGFGGAVGGGNNPEADGGGKGVGSPRGVDTGGRGPGSGPISGDIGGGNVGRSDENKGVKTDLGGKTTTPEKPLGGTLPDDKRYRDPKSYSFFRNLDRNGAGGGNNPNERAGHTPGDGSGNDGTPNDNNSGNGGVSGGITDPKAWQNMRTDPNGGEGFKAKP